MRPLSFDLCFVDCSTTESDWGPIFNSSWMLVDAIAFCQPAIVAFSVLGRLSIPVIYAQLYEALIMIWCLEVVRLSTSWS